MKLKLPRGYKLILSLALVVGPFTWLMFTEDGQRRSDLLILHILGNPSFNIAYDRLDGSVTEAEVAELFPKVHFRCADRASGFGDRACFAEIASFNGLPARSARLHYRAGHLRVMQLAYRERYHDLLVDGLRSGLGDPERQFAGDATVLAWQLEGGLVLLPESPPEDEADAVLMWLEGMVDGATMGAGSTRRRPD